MIKNSMETLWDRDSWETRDVQSLAEGLFRAGARQNSSELVKGEVPYPANAVQHIESFKDRLTQSFNNQHLERSVISKRAGQGLGRVEGRFRFQPWWPLDEPNLKHELLDLYTLTLDISSHDGHLTTGSELYSLDLLATFLTFKFCIQKLYCLPRDGKKMHAGHAPRVLFFFYSCASFWFFTRFFKGFCLFCAILGSFANFCMILSILLTYFVC